MELLFYIFLIGVAGLVVFAVNFLIKGQQEDDIKQKELNNKESVHRMEMLRLEEEFKSQESNLKRLQQDHMVLLEELDSAKKRDLDLKAQLSELKQDADNSLEQKESFAQELKKKMEYLLAAGKEKAELSLKIEENEKEADLLKNTNIALANENEALKKQANESGDLKEQLSSKDTEIRALKESQKSSIDQEADIRKKLEEAERTLRIIHGEIEA